MITSAVRASLALAGLLAGAHAFARVTRRAR